MRRASKRGLARAGERGLSHESRAGEATRGVGTPSTAAAAAASATLAARLAALEAHFASGPAPPHDGDLFASRASTADADASEAHGALEAADAEDHERLDAALREVRALDERLEALERQSAAAALERAHQRAQLRARMRELEVRREQQRFARLRRARAGRAAEADDAEDGAGDDSGSSASPRPVAGSAAPPMRLTLGTGPAAASSIAAKAGRRDEYGGAASVHSFRSLAPSLVASRRPPALLRTGGEQILTSRPVLRKEPLGPGVGAAAAPRAPQSLPSPSPPPPPPYRHYEQLAPARRTDAARETEDIWAASASPALLPVQTGHRSGGAAAAARLASVTVAQWRGGDCEDELAEAEAAALGRRRATPRALTAAEEARVVELLRKGDEAESEGVVSLLLMAAAQAKGAGTGEP